MSCLPWWLRRQKIVVYFPLWCTGRKNLCCWATHRSRYGRAQTVSGCRDSVTEWPTQIPLPLARTCAGLGTATPRSEPHTAVSLLLPRHRDSPRGWESTAQAAPGRERRNGSQPGAWAAAWRNACLAARKRLMAHTPCSCSKQKHPSSQQARSALSPWLQHLRPCTEAWKDGVLRKHPLPSHPARCEAHAMAGRWEYDTDLHPARAPACRVLPVHQPDPLRLRRG